MCENTYEVTLDQRGCVHGDTSFHYHGPPTAGLSRRWTESWPCLVQAPVNKHNAECATLMISSETKPTAPYLFANVCMFVCLLLY